MNTKLKNLSAKATYLPGRMLSADAPVCASGGPEFDDRHLERQELLESNVQLEISRDRYARLYDFAPVGYLTLNQSGCIAKINLIGAWLLKGSRERLEGKSFLCFIAKPDRQKFLRHLMLCRQRRGERLSTELWLKPDSNGLAACVELISSIPVSPISESLVYNSVLIDVTRRKEAENGERAAREQLELCVRERTRELTLSNQALEGKIAEHRLAERALRESEERWRLMIEGTRDYAIFMLDTHGRVVTWNAAAQQVNGYRADEVLGRHFSCFYTTDDVCHKIPERLLKNAMGQGRAEMEGWRVRKNRSRFWSNVVITALRDPAGRLRGFLQIERDITEQMRAQTVLRESEEKLADFFERSPIGLVWAGPDERIMRVNQAWVDLAGCPRSDCLDRRLSDFFLDLKTASQLLGRLRQREVVHDQRARIRCGDGSTRTALVDADGLWEKGRLLHARCFIRDITQHVQLEREILLVSEREQRRIGRDLHDDLCQQLTGIEFLSQTLAAELVQRSPEAAARAKEIAALVRQSITHTRELARGLSPMQLETMGLPGALHELSRRSRRLFGIDCSFHCQKGFSNHRDDAVSVHLYRIAQEAVGNAVKHGKARRVEISLKARKDGLTLAVNDDGTGMPSPFPKRRGMGLHIMKYRADAIGGTLSLQRNRKGGASIICTVKEINGKTNGEKAHERNKWARNGIWKKTHLYC